VDDRLIVVPDDPAQLGFDRVDCQPFGACQHTTADYAVEPTPACCVWRAADG
jgi:hypothetical protein